MGHQGLGAVLVVSATSVMMLLSSGVAQAGSSPNVVGQKYSDATSAISGAGLHPVVSTVVGDQKAWPDCVVTRAQQRTVQPPANSTTHSAADRKVGRHQIRIMLVPLASSVAGIAFVGFHFKWQSSHLRDMQVADLPT